MASDKLEKLLQEERDALKTLETVDADRLWAAISPALSKEPEPSVAPTRGGHWRIGRNWLWMAAAASVLLAAIAWQLMVPPSTYSPENMQAYLATLDPDMAERERMYIEQVAERSRALELEYLTEEERIAFEHDMAILETLWKEISSHATVHPDKEKWLGLLMRYYEQKIRVLEHLSRQIEKKKNAKYRENHVRI